MICIFPEIAVYDLSSIKKISKRFTSHILYPISPHIFDIRGEEGGASDPPSWGGGHTVGSLQESSMFITIVVINCFQFSKNNIFGYFFYPIIGRVGKAIASWLLPQVIPTNCQVIPLLNRVFFGFPFQFQPKREHNLFLLCLINSTNLLIRAFFLRIWNIEMCNKSKTNPCFYWKKYNLKIKMRFLFCHSETTDIFDCRDWHCCDDNVCSLKGGRRDLGRILNQAYLKDNLWTLSNK